MATQYRPAPWPNGSKETKTQTLQKCRRCFRFTNAFSRLADGIRRARLDILQQTLVSTHWTCWTMGGNASRTGWIFGRKHTCFCAGMGGRKDGMMHEWTGLSVAQAYWRVRAISTAHDANQGGLFYYLTPTLPNISSLYFYLSLLLYEMSSLLSIYCVQDRTRDR